MNVIDYRDEQNFNKVATGQVRFGRQLGAKASVNSCSIVNQYNVLMTKGAAGVKIRYLFTDILTSAAYYCLSKILCL